MSKISLGRYVPYNSVVHKIDPRAKIFCLIVMMVAAFISYSSWGMTFVMGGALLVAVGALLIVSKVSIKEIFNSLKVMWLFVILILLINILIPNNVSGEIAFKIGELSVYWESIFQSLKIVIRLVLMIELTMLLTATTKPLDLTYALEWFMTPLKAIKFPTHEIAMVISIALRFIPTLLDETDRIMKAQASRGVDFKHGTLASKLRALVSLIIPLFISAFQRSEELADSMEARGYNPQGKRTRYRVLKFTYIDPISALSCSLLLALLIIVKVTGFTLF